LGNSRVLRVVPGRLSSARPKGPDVAALQRAVQQFLRATGADPKNPDIKDTPRLVAHAWTNEFLDGYGRQPKEALADFIPVPKGQRQEMVVVTGLTFRSVCPHHLLPWAGTASIAYVPGRWLLGFGRFSTLLDILGHRLVLQETLAQDVVSEVMKGLGARGAACMLRGEHMCMRMRGGGQRHAVTWAESYAGAFQKSAALRDSFTARASGPLA
jgi:GTP cyclohydrolase I